MLKQWLWLGAYNTQDIHALAFHTVVALSNWVIGILCGTKRGY
jgi:hypothetical protein